MPCSRRTFPCFLLELLGGNGSLRSLRNGARLWNKKVNLLVACFAGYECFQPLLFMAHSLCLLKEKEYICRLFGLFIFLCSLEWAGVFSQFSCQIKCHVRKQQFLAWCCSPSFSLDWVCLSFLYFDMFWLLLKMKNRSCPSCTVRRFVAFLFSLNIFLLTFLFELLTCSPV